MKIDSIHVCKQNHVHITAVYDEEHEKQSGGVPADFILSLQVPIMVDTGEGKNPVIQVVPAALSYSDLEDIIQAVKDGKVRFSTDGTNDAIVVPGISGVTD